MMVVMGSHEQFEVIEERRFRESHLFQILRNWIRVLEEGLSMGNGRGDRGWSDGMLDPGMVFKS